MPGCVQHLIIPSSLRHLSYRLFQQLSILLQPGPCLFHCRRLRTDNVHKFGRVVGLDEVGKFMDDDVIDNKHWRFYQPPVEIDVVIHGAGSPTVAVVDNLDLSKIDTEFACMMLDPWDNLFFGLANIPLL